MAEIFGSGSIRAVEDESKSLERPQGALARGAVLGRPVSTEIGAWGGQEWVRIIGRHMTRRQKNPDEYRTTCVNEAGMIQRLYAAVQRKYRPR